MDTLGRGIFSLIPCRACISRVFKFANFTNLESFTKFVQLKFEPLRFHAHGQHASAKFFQQIPVIHENLDLRNISIIQ